MAIGKKKKMMTNKKGKRKPVDPFLKKEWYTIKAPALFPVRACGKTLITKTIGQKVASDGLKGRIFEFSLGDLNKDEDQSWRKVSLSVEDVQGYDCLTNFHGLDCTRDKLCSLIKKWQSIIEASVEVRTTDGYLLRLFCTAFTKKMPNQLKKTCYASGGQQRVIRKKMMDRMIEVGSTNDLSSLIKKLMSPSGSTNTGGPNGSSSDLVGSEIEKACHGVFPIKDVLIRKVKVLKKPKFDLIKLMEVHAGGKDVEMKGEDVGGVVGEKIVEGVVGSGGRL